MEKEEIIERMKSFLEEIKAVKKEDGFLTIEAIAIRFNCSATTVRRLAKKMGVGVLVLNGRKLIAMHDVKKLQIRRKYNSDIIKFDLLMKKRNSEIQ